MLAHTTFRLIIVATHVAYPRQLFQVNESPADHPQPRRAAIVPYLAPYVARPDAVMTPVRKADHDVRECRTRLPEALGELS